MSPPPGEVTLMETTSRPNDETQELIRLLHQTKKKLPILSYDDLADGSIKLVLDTLVAYEPNHESPPLSIIDAKDFTASLINFSTTIVSPRYHEDSYKSVM